MLTAVVREQVEGLLERGAIKKNDEEGVLSARPEKGWIIELDSSEEEQHNKIFNIFPIDLKGNFGGNSIDIISQRGGELY